MIAVSSFLLMFAVLIAEWRGLFARVHRTLAPLVPLARRFDVFLLAIVMLPLLFAAQLHVDDHLAAHPIARAVAAHLPSPITDDDVGDFHLRYLLVRPLASTALLAIALLESLALGCVALRLRAHAGRREVLLIALAAAAMIVGAFVPRAMTSGDAYTYVAYALLGQSAYAPPSTPFAGPYHAINLWWGTPIATAPYGPLWLEMISLLTFSATTLTAKIEMFRIAGLGTLAALALVLGYGRFGTAIVALVVLNPFLYEQYVVTPHNDLLPIVSVTAAFIAARRRPIIAMVGVAAAGLMKLPFVVIGALAFAPLPNRMARLALAAASAVVALVISALWGGPAYIRSLAGTIHNHSLNHPELPMLLTLIVGVSILLALLDRPRLRGAALCFSAVGAFPYPWYVIWGLPYALVDRASLALFLIVLPTLGAMLSMTIMVTEHKVVLIVALLIASIPRRGSSPKPL